MSALAKDTEILRYNTQNNDSKPHVRNGQNLSNIYIDDEGDGGIEERYPRGIEDIPLPTDRSHYEGMGTGTSTGTGGGAGICGGIGGGLKGDGIAGGKSHRGEKDKGFVLSESMALVHAREILALSNR